MLERMRTRDPISGPAGLDEARPTRVSVRAIRATDASELQRFYAGLSPESRRTRFLNVNEGLSLAQSTSFCTTDHDHREGFVAIVGDGPTGGERIIGHLCVEPDGVDAAEVAIAVADAFQRRGIGRRLMAAGMAWARREHIARLTATAFADNAAILALLAGLGLSTRMAYAGAGVSEVTIDLVAQSVAA